MIEDDSVENKIPDEGEAIQSSPQFELLTNSEVIHLSQGANLSEESRSEDDGISLAASGSAPFDREGNNA